MHASTEELLSVRDGETVAETVVSHVEACEHCQSQLGRLSMIRSALGNLPEIVPPDDAWQRILAHHKASRPRERRNFVPQLIGLAASVLAVAVVLQVLDDPGRRAVRGMPESSTPASQTATSEIPPAAVAQQTGMGASAAAAAVPLATLISRSQRLENTLRALPRGPQLVTGSTAGTITELQDRIAMVDYQMSLGQLEDQDPDMARRLWQERIGLMNSLLAVRFAQAQQVSF